MRNLWCFGIVLAAASAAAAQDMPLTQVILPGEGWKPAGVDCASAAGLAGDGRGDVYVADPDGRRIWRIDKDGKASVFTKTDGCVHGLAAAADGRLFAAEPEAERILVFDATGKEVARHEHLAATDLVVTKSGDCYYTVPAEGAVYLFGADGQTRKVAAKFKLTGALSLWNDGGTLVVADAGDRYMYAFRVRKNGDLDAREPYYLFQSKPSHLNLIPFADVTTHPSIPWEGSENAGLTLDAAGRAYATSREGVQVFDPTGRLSGVLLAPEREALGGVAFGGADLDRLYVACGGKVYVRKLAVKGVKAAEKTGS